MRRALAAAAAGGLAAGRPIARSGRRDLKSSLSISTLPQQKASSLDASRTRAAARGRCRAASCVYRTFS